MAGDPMGGDAPGGERAPAATVLVVEDTMVNRLALARGVEREGHRVVQAGDGAEALQVLGSEPVDMVLLDLIMPEVDGFAVLERMAADTDLREIPVLVISAVESSEEVARALEMGAIDCLPKPVDPVLLRVRMRTALEQARLRALEQDYLRQELAMREQERLATLGRLSAGLGHELNNPAAAALSTARQVRDGLTSADRLLSHTLQRPDGAAIVAAAEDLRTRHAGQREAPSTDGTADLDAAVEDALADVGLTDPWNHAADLARLGVTATHVRTLADGLGDAAALAIEWLVTRGRIERGVERIIASVERMATLTAALRGYSYLDRAPQQDVDVRRGLDDTLTILEHKRPDTLTVTRDYADDVPRIHAFGGQLNQVWTNLIDNAIDAAGDGGTIIVRARPDDHGGVLVEVEDDGPGVPDELQGKLFDPFVTTKPPGHGTGLGLSISRQIVTDVHGGSLRLTSRPGATVLQVRLPPTPPREPDDES